MLRIVMCSLREANAFVALHHRHNKPVRGCKFTMAVSDGQKVVGVAIVGRPVARRLDDGSALEVLRCTTDGTKNACSALYGACWRAARAIGCIRLVTYTQQGEPGTSLLASGWKVVAETKGGSWNREDRPREDKASTEPKRRWEVAA